MQTAHIYLAKVINKIIVLYKVYPIILLEYSNKFIFFFLRNRKKLNGNFKYCSQYCEWGISLIDFEL